MLRYALSPSPPSLCSSYRPQSCHFNHCSCPPPPLPFLISFYPFFTCINSSCLSRRGGGGGGAVETLNMGQENIRMVQHSGGGAWIYCSRSVVVCLTPGSRRANQHVCTPTHWGRQESEEVCRPFRAERARAAIRPLPEKFITSSQNVLLCILVP